MEHRGEPAGRKGHDPDGGSVEVDGPGDRERDLDICVRLPVLLVVADEHDRPVTLQRAAARRQDRHKRRFPRSFSESPPGKHPVPGGKAPRGGGDILDNRFGNRHTESSVQRVLRPQDLCNRMQPPDLPLGFSETPCEVFPDRPGIAALPRLQDASTSERPNPSQSRCRIRMPPRSTWANV